MESFGEKIGKLVRKYRDSRGDTLDSLIAEMKSLGLKSESGKPLRIPRASTISDIENGKVPRPNAATVKVLVEALKIPQAEVDACRDASAGNKKQQREINKLNAYVKALEAQLETQKEELRTAHDAERAMLQKKMGELIDRLAHPEAAFREYRDKIAQLEQLLGGATGATLAIGANRIADAKALAEEGQFEAADEIFAEVEELEQDAVTRASEAAFGRGLIAEEQIRWADAARHYAKAAKFKESFEALRKASDFAERSGAYAVALRFSEDLIAFAKAHESRERLANALNEHALNHKAQGRYPEAEALYRAALEIDRATIGEGHPDYAIHLNNLAGVVQAQGRYPEAEALFREALEIGRATIGEEHPDYATRLNNLAVVVRAQGRYPEAEALFREALEIDRATIGEEHPDYATHLNNLALVVRAQGRYPEAEALYREALEITRATIGEAHPDYATHLNNLALVVRAQGRYPEAEALFREALEIDRATIGEEHPDYATHLNNLALVVRAQGRYPEAEALYREALEITRATIGEEHPAYATRLNNLAVNLYYQDRFAEAEPLMVQALAILEKALPADHPDIASARQSLAAIRAKLSGPDAR